MKCSLNFCLSIGIFLVFPCLCLAAQPPPREAATQKLEAFATQGWTEHILTLRTHIEEIKSNVDVHHYQLLLAAEYRNLFVCWLMCDGPDSVIRSPKNRKTLIHFVKQIYPKIIKDVRGADDPLRVASNDKTDAFENLKRMQVELVDENVEIPQLASPEVYRDAVTRFRKAMDDQ
jgi:hypothetical protein